MGRKRNAQGLPKAAQDVWDSLSAPVVTIFVRHSADCKHKNDEFFRECRCRKHLRWFHNGKLYRQTTSARSWEEAEKAKSRVEEELANRVRQLTPTEQTVKTLQPSPAELTKFLVWEDARRTPEEIARLLTVRDKANRSPEFLQSDFFNACGSGEDSEGL